MNEKIPNQNIRESVIEAKPELDKIVEDINESIAVMMACRGNLKEPACRTAFENKKRLQQENEQVLIEYLKPYFGLDWDSDAQAATTLEWARYRVAHNWNFKG